MKRIITLFVALAVLVVSPGAFAKSSDALIRHVPHDSQILVGLEIPELKKSFLFSEAISVLKEQAGAKSVLSFVLGSEAFDIEKDVDSMLVALDEAPTNPQSPQTPASVIVLQGKLDAEKVLASAKKEFGNLKKTKKGKLEIYSGSGLDMAFVSKDVLVITEQGSYGAATWKAAKDPKKSASSNKDIKALMKLVPTTGKGMWVTMETKGMPTTPNSPPMDGAALTVDVAAGIALDFRSKFQKEEDANAALKQFKEMKKQSGNDPLISMLGAKPLLDNLDAKVEKKTVLAMKTSMNETELKSLLTKIKAMSQAPPPATGGPQKGPTSGPTKATPPPTGKGADADFN